MVVAGISAINSSYKGVFDLPSLKLTASSPRKIGLLPEEERIVFQPSISRCKLLVSGRVLAERWECFQLFWGMGKNPTKYKQLFPGSTSAGKTRCHSVIYYIRRLENYVDHLYLNDFGCNRHWKQAQQGAARRSQSRRVRKTKENQQTTERNSKALNSNAEKEDKVNTPVEEIFSARLPWVVNSPHARAPVETKTSLVEEPTSALPVPPEAKSSSEATSGSSEEDLAKVHQHLKALKTALGSLPEELERKLAACEDKAREKALSHGHLNRLGKVNKQMKAIASKIQTMDQGWKQFAQTVATKFNEHRQLYHKSREGLMQDYLSKAQELQAAKEEVQLASQHLFAAQMEAPAESLPDATAAMMEAALQEDTFLEPTKFDGYALEENPIEVDEDELMQVAEGMKPPARAPIQPFSRKVTSSPTKVANLHLKTKEAEKPKTK